MGLIHGDGGLHELRLEDGQGLGDGHRLQLRVWDVDRNLQTEKKGVRVPLHSVLL